MVTTEMVAVEGSFWVEMMVVAWLKLLLVGQMRDKLLLVLMKT